MDISKRKSIVVMAKEWIYKDIPKRNKPKQPNVDCKKEAVNIIVKYCFKSNQIFEEKVYVRDGK